MKPAAPENDTGRVTTGERWLVYGKAEDPSAVRGRRYGEKVAPHEHHYDHKHPGIGVRPAFGAWRDAAGSPSE